jgi:hypothetical protein
MGRVIPCAAIVLATSALVVSLAGRDKTALPPAPESEERLSRLETKLDEALREMATVSERLSSSPARAAVAEKKMQAALRSKQPLPEDATWPVIARRLTSDLKLTEKQTSVLDISLEECARALSALPMNSDKKRAEMHANLARRRAFRNLDRTLDKDQESLFGRLVRDPKCPDLAGWFAYNKPCSGCGKSKSKRTRGKSGT